MIPVRKRVGQILRASEINALGEAARVALSTVSGAGIDASVGPGGITIAQQGTSPLPPGCCWCHNAATHTYGGLGVYGLVWLRDGYPANTSDELIIGTLPRFPGQSNLGVALTPAGIGGVAIVQYMVGSIARVRVNAAVTTNQRLGSSSYSVNAQVSEIGPLEVLSDAPDIVEGGVTTHTAIVRITDRRAGCIYVSGFQGTNAVQGVCNMLVCNEGVDWVPGTAPAGTIQPA